MESDKHSVYKLDDPITDEIRYVGMTNNPEKRLKQHIRCKGEINIDKNIWIKSLKKRNLLPIMRIIETTETRQEAFKRERYWILHYLLKNARLCNINIDNPLEPINPIIAQVVLDAPWKPIPPIIPVDDNCRLLIKHITLARSILERAVKTGTPRLQRQAFGTLCIEKDIPYSALSPETSLELQMTLRNKVL